MNPDGLIQQLEKIIGAPLSEAAKECIESSLLNIVGSTILRTSMTTDLAWQLTQEATAYASRSTVEKMQAASAN